MGLYPADMEAKNILYETWRKDFHDNDRNRTEGETTGFVKIHVERGTDRILGATIVGEAAGDMISEITVAMSCGMRLSALVRKCWVLVLCCMESSFLLSLTPLDLTCHMAYSPCFDISILIGIGYSPLSHAGGCN